jgi:hypothetical protein
VMHVLADTVERSGDAGPVPSGGRRVELTAAGAAPVLGLGPSESPRSQQH